jgi:hypothetical protein
MCSCTPNPHLPEQDAEEPNDGRRGFAGIILLILSVLEPNPYQARSAFRAKSTPIPPNRTNFGYEIDYTPKAYAHTQKAPEKRHKRYVNDT